MSQGARGSWPRKPVLSLSKRILPLVAWILHFLERPSRRRASRDPQDEAEGDSARVQSTSARLDRPGSPGVGSLVRLADEYRMRNVDDGGETILDAGGDKTQRVLFLRPGEDAGGRQVRPGIAWEAA